MKMKMKKISTLKRNLFTIIAIEAIIIAIYFLDFKIFINLQIASLSSFLIIIASNYTYKRMVNSKLKTGIYDNEDPLDKIEDPYELYDEDEINQTPIEDLDVKQIIKDEKKKIKIINPKSLKYGIKGGFSLLRLGGYLFLIAGFIALKNNHLLDLKIYLPSILIGIVLGNMIYTKKGDL
jgi:hypothetical protein